MMPSLCVALASVGLCCNTFGGVKDISSRASSGESNISVVPGVWCAIFGDVGGESVGDGGGVFFLFFLELITSVHSDSSVKLFIWVPSSLLAKNCFSSNSISVASSISGSWDVRNGRTVLMALVWRLSLIGMSCMR